LRVKNTGMALIGFPSALAQRYVVNAISQMSKSSPRTIRRIAAVMGSTATKSSGTFAFTTPPLSGVVNP